jgi:hypothetical protein
VKAAALEKEREIKMDITPDRVCEIFIGRETGDGELHSLATAKNGMRFDNYCCWVVYFKGEVIVKVLAHLDCAMVAQLFAENAMGA